jgi:phosphatidylglycerol---prolipoprotein diacylglyceryl transferase
MMSMALLSLPSPPSPVAFEAGPLVLSYHGLFIAVGIVAGTWLTAHELRRKGHEGSLALGLLLFVIPLGLLGARLYHVLTEYDRYAGHTAAMFKAWEGGVGIYGAVAGGLVGLVLFGWYRGVSPLVLADAAAPGLILAQAIGRWGNYFNQELFGRPSDLPWAIRIAPENRPAQFPEVEAFHPTFLYESIWNLLVCFVLLWVARRFADRLRDGDLVLLYVSLYSVGRFFVETLRVDPAFLIGGSIRGNLFVSSLLALGCAMILLLRHSRPPRKPPESA